MAILTIVIGIVFVLLLLSLLATTIMELLAAVLKLRGKNLTKALRNMLASCDEDETLLKAFQGNSLYKHLTDQYGRKSTGPPSYMNEETFQSILFEVILKGEGADKLKERIAELPDEDLRNVLTQLLNDADFKLDEFKERVRWWYSSVMDRASGWYKRYTQKILVVLGLLIAVIFNADTLSMYSRLERNPEALAQVVSMAETFVQQNDQEALERLDPDFQQSYMQLKGLLTNEIESVSSPLGLGWDNVDLENNTTYDWASRVLGWLVTALAISLGAPFWFDLLRKIVNVRSSGSV